MVLYIFSVKMRGVVPIFRHRRVTAAVCEKGVFFGGGIPLGRADICQRRHPKKGGETHCRRVGWGPIVSPFLFRGKRRHGWRERKRERDKKRRRKCKMAPSEKEQKKQVKVSCRPCQKETRNRVFFQIQFHLISLSLSLWEQKTTGLAPSPTFPHHLCSMKPLWLLVISIHTDVRHLRKDKNIEHKRRSAHLSLKPATST